MNVTVLLNALGLGGTEKAACLWAKLLVERAPGIKVQVVALTGGARSADLRRYGISCHVCEVGHDVAGEVASQIEGADVIHSHCPGTPHHGDVLGDALKQLGRKIPVVQTNIFGRLDNPAEDEWTDFRLFISWTSCVQAAARSRRRLDSEFFRNQSVAVYPVMAPTEVELLRWQESAKRLREEINVNDRDILFGRFSRPEPNKWTPIVLHAFAAAWLRNKNIHLLLREPPAEVRNEIDRSGLARNIHILPATADPDELASSQVACDVVLHTSSFGESFGYGIAEPMALGKPVITNSTPWRDQAQIELVRQGECGYVVGTGRGMAERILQLAGDESIRLRMGATAKEHILELADPTISAERVQAAFSCACEGRPNPNQERDIVQARATVTYLGRHQWGQGIAEKCYLRAFTAKVLGIRAWHYFKKRLVSVLRAGNLL